MLMLVIKGIFCGRPLHRLVLLADRHRPQQLLQFFLSRRLEKRRSRIQQRGCARKDLRIVFLVMRTEVKRNKLHHLLLHPALFCQADLHSQQRNQDIFSHSKHRTRITMLKLMLLKAKLPQSINHMMAVKHKHLLFMKIISFRRMQIIRYVLERFWLNCFTFKFLFSD